MVEVTFAVEWLRAISGWLLETDNDMKLPGGVLDVDPLDIANALEESETAAMQERIAELEGVLGIICSGCTATFNDITNPTVLWIQSEARAALGSAKT